MASKDMDKLVSHAKTSGSVSYTHLDVYKRQQQLFVIVKVRRELL